MRGLYALRVTHQRRALAGNFQLLVGRNHEYPHPAFGNRQLPDAGAAELVGFFAELDAEEIQVLTGQAADAGVVFAYAPREHNGFGPVEDGQVGAQVFLMR